MVNIRINILMKGAGKKIFKNKQINKNIQKKTKKKNTTRVQESWLNLKDTPQWNPILLQKKNARRKK